MKEERLKVLQMLEDGKINVDDAIKLFDSMKFKECDNKSKDFEEKIKKLSKNVDSIAKDFGNKVSEVYKNMEPKVRKTTQSVIQKTANVIQDLSNKLSDKSDSEQND